MLGRFAPGICRASGPGQVIADVGHKNNRYAMREIGIGGRETFGGIGEGFLFTGV